MKAKSGSEINRRDFVKAAMAAGTVTTIGTLAGCSKAATADSTVAKEESLINSETTAKAWDLQPSSIADQVTSTQNYDVVVVGGGNSGMICALKAAELGGNVIVLEQNNDCTMWAGDINAIDSQLLKDEGIELDREFIIHDLVRYGNGRVDENLIRLWAYNSGTFVDWYQNNLQKKGGDVMVDIIRKEFYPENCYFTTPYHSAYIPPLKETDNHMGSEAAMPLIKELFTDLGGIIEFKTTAVELVQEAKNEKVTGVIAQNDDGEYIQYNASRGVVLACGGFLGNKDMLDQLSVTSTKYCSNHLGADGRNGDGIKFATWAGADKDRYFSGSTLCFDRGCITGDETEGDIGSNGQGGGNANIWWPGSQPFLRVNSLGNRYCNEDGPYDFEMNMAIQQPGNYWWQVFDSSSWEDVKKFGTTICARVVAEEGAKNCNLLGQYYPCTSAQEWDEVYIQPNVEKGNLITCNTIEELAEQMNVPLDNFQSTIDRYNEIYSMNEDVDHGKAPWRLSEINEPPYYAAKMAGWALATLGGIHVDYNFHPVTPKGEPIEGLYQCGLDVGGFFNGNYPEYYGGLCMGRAVVLAWLAAMSIMDIDYPVPVESARDAY